MFVHLGGWPWPARPSALSLSPSGVPPSIHIAIRIKTEAEIAAAANNRINHSFRPQRVRSYLAPDDGKGSDPTPGPVSGVLDSCSAA